MNEKMDAPSQEALDLIAGIDDDARFMLATQALDQAGVAAIARILERVHRLDQLETAAFVAQFESGR